MVINDNVYFTLSQHKNGFWIYNKLLGYNVAIKAKTESEAYSDAIISMTGSINRITEDRESLRGALGKIREFLDDAHIEGE